MNKNNEFNNTIPRHSLYKNNNSIKFLTQMLEKEDFIEYDEDEDISKTYRRYRKFNFKVDEE